MKKIIVFLSALATFAAFAISCGNVTDPTEENGGGGAGAGAGLTTNTFFRDDFDGTEINKDIWTLCYQEYDAKGKSPTWNRFFDNTEGWENVKVEGGYLKLKANYAPSSGGEYQQFKTGGVYTYNNKFTVGSRVTVKAVLVEGNDKQTIGSKFNITGAFPAIWYYPLGTPNEWPADGEIDMMEWISSEPNRAWLTVQCLRTSGNSASVTADMSGVNNNIKMYDWHVYTCDILKDKVILYIDGTKALEFTTTNPSDQKWYPYNDVAQYLILNASYQNGSWGPTVPLDYSSNYEMWVDYVYVEEIDPTNPNPTAPTYK